MSEELNRRYHELKGCRFEDYHNGGGFWHKRGCQDRQRGSSCKCGGHWYLPHLHKDLNLAIDEANREFPSGYQLTIGAGVVISVPWRSLPVGDPNPVDVEMIEESGSTINEAILKALIQKLEAR